MVHNWQQSKKKICRKKEYNSFSFVSLESHWLNLINHIILVVHFGYMLLIMNQGKQEK